MARPIVPDHWMYADIQKVDEEKRQVFGYASTERVDSQGEVVLRSAVEAALPDYMVWRNVREMHQPSAVGNAIEANMGEKGLWFGAHVVDDRAWNKVRAGVYKGFSIGGKVTARDPANKKIITGISLTEISLVDRPSNPDARFELIKRDDTKLRPQPTQIWACGCPGHQHLNKLDASLCMQDTADTLAKLSHDEEIEEEAPALAKATPRGVLKPAFIGHAKSAAEAKSLAESCGTDAASCDNLASRHDVLAKESQNAGNSHAMMLHQRIAQGHRALAAHKRQQAKDYMELATRHDMSEFKRGPGRLLTEAEVLERANALHKAIQIKKAALEEVL